MRANARDRLLLYVVRGKEDNPEAIGCVCVSQEISFFFHSTKIPEKNELTDYSEVVLQKNCVLIIVTPKNVVWTNDVASRFDLELTE